MVFGEQLEMVAGVGRLLRGLQGLVVGVGHGMFLHRLGPGDQSLPAWNPSPGVVRNKTPVVRDVVGDCYGFESAAFRSLEVLLGGCRAAYRPLEQESRELGPAAMNPDTHLSRGIQSPRSSCSMPKSCTPCYTEVIKHKSTFKVNLRFSK